MVLCNWLTNGEEEAVPQVWLMAEKRKRPNPSRFQVGFKYFVKIIIAYMPLVPISRKGMIKTVCWIQMYTNGHELQEFIDLWVSKLELNLSPHPHLVPISLNKNYSIPLDHGALFSAIGACFLHPYILSERSKPLREQMNTLKPFYLIVHLLSAYINLQSILIEGPRYISLLRMLNSFLIFACVGELEYPLENSLGLSKDFVFGQFAAHLSRLEYLMMDVTSFEVSEWKHLRFLFASSLFYYCLIWFLQGKQQFNKLPLFSNLKHLSLTCLNSSHGHEELRYLKEVLVSGFFGNELAKVIILSIFNFAIELEKIEITTVLLYDLSKPVAVNEVVGDRKQGFNNMFLFICNKVHSFTRPHGLGVAGRIGLVSPDHLLIWLSWPLCCARRNIRDRTLDKGLGTN
ncbi:hypothetical protein GQ457_17G000260 [Hibiscus cannabinus]